MRGTATQWLAAVLAAAQLQLPSAVAQSNNNNSSPPQYSPSPSPASNNLPTVDLGYELHQAIAFNDTGKYYNFSNIRFAAPVTGDNRWRVPQSPAVNRSTVQNGAEARICPQAGGTWSTDIAPKFVVSYLTTGRTNFTPADFPASNSTPPKDGPGVNEDCLFLDVMVPERIFKSAGRGYGAPVLVWIYGGGYTGGSKAGSGSPAGLIARSQDDNNSPGVVYVALNYRLGAFGWQAGPTFQEDGTANLGLYDQRFALEWIQKNIRLFGGDPNRVTVLGESAGGGSIMHQITAYGGAKGKVPFQQAIPQSPGWQPIVSSNSQEKTFQRYLELLNVSTLAEARKLPYEQLQAANVKQISASNYGTYTYGPVVDGDFVPDLPGQLLARGQFDDSVNVMVGHNANEGLVFTSPFINNETAIRNQLQTSIPTIKAFPEVQDEILELYPAANYSNSIARASAIISELSFVCNTFYLNGAYGNNTYAYLFSVPPALHGFDVPYTFFNGGSQNVTVATALQDYITSFALHGVPNEEGVPYFNMYGQNATIQNLGNTGITQMMDPAANERCNFWQKALYA